MKKIATILSFLVLQTLFCQSVLSKFQVKGSLLCGEKTYGVTLFEDTTMMFSVVNRTISCDTLSKIVMVNYELIIDPQNVKNDTIVLNNILPPINGTFTNNMNWTIQRTYLYKTIGRFYVKPDTTRSIFYPYGTCFKVSYDCDSISVERNTLEAKCPILKNIGKLNNISNSNDTITATFIDSLNNSSIVCFGIGFNHIKSKLTYKHPSNKNYFIKAINKQEFSGIIPAIYLLDLSKKIIYLGKADLSKCIATALDDVELNTIEVYPNPASDKVYITSKPEIIQLIDVYGQQHSINGNGKYDVTKLMKGIYTVLYQQNGKMIREKLVLE